MFYLTFFYDDASLLPLPTSLQGSSKAGVSTALDCPECLISSAYLGINFSVPFTSHWWREILIKGGSCTDTWGYPPLTFLYDKRWLVIPTFCLQPLDELFVCKGAFLWWCNCLVLLINVWPGNLSKIFWNFKRALSITFPSSACYWHACKILKLGRISVYRSHADCLNRWCFTVYSVKPLKLKRNRKWK